MEQNKPNLIIVMTDQQRADLRKACGYELDTMPFLDEWGCGGVDFEKAYTPNPTCLPARVSMFTGRYSQSHQARTNHNEKDALYTKDLLDILKENGYRTALCGKNHSHHPMEDFDFWETSGHLGYEGERNTTPEEFAFADFLKATKHMETHTPSPGGVEVQHPYRNVSSAFKFIDSVKDQPFFAWVSFAEPHNPYQVPEPYFDLFPPEILPPVHSGKEILPEKGEKFVWTRGIWEQVLGEQIEDRILRARSNYHGMLRLIDDQFKRLILGLRERNLEENTIVIFLSDHGDFVGEYGLIRKGPDLPDILSHIPMVWRGPGIAAQGRTSSGFVNLVDVLPTICDLLGVEIPFGCQGKSILPLLQGGTVPAGEFDSTLSESGFSGLYWNNDDALTVSDEDACSKEMDRFDCLNTWTQCGQIRSLWKGDFRIQMDMMGNGYLYDLKHDPFELRNLWNEQAYAQIKGELLAELTAAILRAVDPLPAPHFRYRTKVHPKGYWFQEDYRSPDPGIRDYAFLGGKLPPREK